jgi:hypothetical protein
MDKDKLYYMMYKQLDASLVLESSPEEYACEGNLLAQLLPESEMPNCLNIVHVPGHDWSNSQWRAQFPQDFFIGTHAMGKFSKVFDNSLLPHPYKS